MPGRTDGARNSANRRCHFHARQVEFWDQSSYHSHLSERHALTHTTFALQTVADDGPPFAKQYFRKSRAHASQGPVKSGQQASAGRLQAARKVAVIHRFAQ
jgi:hypothetical protein